jgi:ATP-binding protein involved in chromosome partitioning
MSKKITKDDVLKILETVEDPELHKSIVECNMVEEIKIDGNNVSLIITLTIPGCPLKDEITNRITSALEERGCNLEKLTFTSMSEEQRAELSTKLNASKPSNNPFTNSNTRILVIASGKGGVGKSSITVNLARALVLEGKKVGILDADVWGFSIPRMIGVDHPPTVIDELVVPPIAHDIQVISMGFFAREDQPVMWRGPMLHKALEQFLTDVMWTELDYLLIDMPPGTGDVSLSIAEFLPRAEFIVVTTPQPAAQKVAQRAAFMAEKVNLPLIGVIENMSSFTAEDGTEYKLFGEGGGELLSEDCDTTFLGSVPFEQALREGSDVGVPIMVSQPDSQSSTAIKQIASKIINELKPTRKSHPELVVK